MGFTEAQVKAKMAEQTDECHNTPTHEAWVASKNGELRCFMEHREYPHRARGSHIEAAN